MPITPYRPNKLTMPAGRPGGRVVVTTRPGLPRSRYEYYLDRGFSFVRMAPDPEPSGACFQRRADIELHLGPDIREEGNALK
jgi:hypothetical protein